MQASDHIRSAMDIVETTPSPWRPELLSHLNHLLRAAYMHESWSQPATPRETALGHRPSQKTVAGHSIATDQALELLDCVD